MKYLLIGSVFSDLNNLFNELHILIGNNIECIDVEEIEAFDGTSFSTAKTQSISWDDLHKVFIRYPYDLLTPFSAEFRDREHTEFWKSVCLLASSKSLNCPMASWGLRNRLFSLKKCEEFGLKVPLQSVQIGDPGEYQSKDLSKPSVLKALGNCFVGEGPIKYQRLKEHCRWMRDGSDEAFVFPAQVGNSDNLASVQAEIGITYCQEQIHGREFRVYSVGSQVFVFEREPRSQNKEAESDMGIDMSDRRLVETDVYLPREFWHGFQKLKSAMRIGYVCLDVILDGKGEPWIIDFNPLGSLPCYNEHPEVHRQLAAELLS
jgi:hypothetical protein